MRPGPCRLYLSRHHAIGVFSLLERLSSWDLRELAPKESQGPELLQIEVKPGIAVSPESLFDARIEIVRTADLEEGGSQTLHESFFEAVTRAEETRP